MYIVHCCVCTGLYIIFIIYLIYSLYIDLCFENATYFNNRLKRMCALLIYYLLIKVNFIFWRVFIM
jgi:hypothetical protein